MKPALKQKMSDFLKDCAERIIILKIVHRRIINRSVFAEVPLQFLVFLWRISARPQVPRLSLVPGPPGLRGARGQRSPLQQNPERICPGVPHDQRARAAAETEEGQPQRAQQDQRENDHRCKSSWPPAASHTLHKLFVRIFASLVSVQQWWVVPPQRLCFQSRCHYLHAFVMTSAADLRIHTYRLQ